ncbi:MAG: T9SS type A sorting domain-containing protein [Bacteroidetes bacterium]|nr:T9SS type A sorting domain-containing protein [Bacteroidota bacterium]MBK8145848.1 T9SS type A sorting domain-containing protein [Bacteroidota bacterium]MBP6315874.1 T9SS type A sorting domain-containing protein [Chitinophagaceae bacterium]
MTFDCIAQFAPQAGLPGSTAIHKDSSIIVEWANECLIHRGWMDMADTTLGKASQGDSTKALGMADGDVVSLGDAGEAILYFANPIIDGNGVDFAIFENGFLNPLDSNLAYLELASVAVSNDGIQYYSFAATCHNDTSAQLAGVGTYMDAQNISNLAGKYISYYGTPFDVNELSMILSLDVNNIHYIKIKDVVGSISKEYCTRDVNNQVINDPYPTPFPTGGFDLDAVAVIHHKFPTEVTLHATAPKLEIYPNPAMHSLFIKNSNEIRNINIRSIDGAIQHTSEAVPFIDIQNLQPGVYFIEFVDVENRKTTQRFIKI